MVAIDTVQFISIQRMNEISEISNHWTEKGQMLRFIHFTYIREKWRKFLWLDNRLDLRSDRQELSDNVDSCYDLQLHRR